MQIIDLVGQLPANLELVVYRSGGETITLAVNQNGACILRARITLSAEPAPPVVDIATTPSPEKPHEQPKA